MGIALRAMIADQIFRVCALRRALQQNVSRGER
jgi:hypothetical protein